MKGDKRVGLAPSTGGYVYLSQPATPTPPSPFKLISRQAHPAFNFNSEPHPHLFNRYFSDHSQPTEDQYHQAANDDGAMQ